MDNYGMLIKMDECFVGAIESHAYENVGLTDWQVNFWVPIHY